MSTFFSLAIAPLAFFAASVWTLPSKAQNTLEFTNKTSCTFGVTIGYCTEECREGCAMEYVRVTLPPGQTDVPLPRGAMAHFMKLQNDLQTFSYAAWSCESGWDVDQFRPRDPNCCPNSLGGPYGVLIDGDGYTTSIVCQ